MKLKRITAALLAGVMCVGLLAGCGSKGDGDEKGSGDKITIRLLTRMAGTTAQVDIYNDILDEFKEKHGAELLPEVLDYLYENRDHRELWKGVPISRDGKVRLRDGSYR